MYIPDLVNYNFILHLASYVANYCLKHFTYNNYAEKTINFMCRWEIIQFSSLHW